MLSTRNKKLGLVLFIFSIIYLYLSFQLPAYNLVPVDADAIPLVLGFLLMILSIVLFFIKDTKQDYEKQKSTLPENKKDTVMLITVAVFIIIYIVILQSFGFIISSLLFIFLTTLLLGYRRHIVNFIVSISVPIAFYYLFDTLLKISLPSGFLPF